jgi:hypothetical protein
MAFLVHRAIINILQTTAAKFTTISCIYSDKKLSMPSGIAAHITINRMLFTCILLLYLLKIAFKRYDFSNIRNNTPVVYPAKYNKSVIELPLYTGLIPNTFNAAIKIETTDANRTFSLVLNVLIISPSIANLHGVSTM